MRTVPNAPWLYPEEQIEVVEHLYERGLIKCDNERQLPLKMGGTTDVYINLRDHRDHPGTATFLARFFAHALRRLEIDRFTEVPLAVSGIGAVISEHSGIPYFTIREQEKEGRVSDAKIIGHPQAGEVVATIDDVITNGASKLAAHLACKHLGLDHRALIVLVDRQQGWRSDFERLGIDVPVWAGMTLHDVRRHLIQGMGVMQRCDPEREKQNRIIIALDGKSWEEILPIVDRCRTSGMILKVNDLAIGGNTPWILENLSVYGRVMLDLKIHDISNTAMNIARRIQKHPPWAVTVHASGQHEMLAKTVQTLKGTGTKVLAVTLLTSINQPVCKELYGHQPPWVVKKLAEVAYGAGADGFVCSPMETAMLRQKYPNALIVNPGVRSPGVNTHDQKRVKTPAGAMEAGADYVVMGRQLLKEVDDPVEEALRVHREELGINL